MAAPEHPEQSRTNLNKSDQDPTTQNYPDQIGTSLGQPRTEPNKPEQIRTGPNKAERAPGGDAPPPSFPPSPSLSVIPAPERESAPRALQRPSPPPSFPRPLFRHTRALPRSLPLARTGVSRRQRPRRPDQPPTPAPRVRRPKLDLGPIRRSLGRQSAEPPCERRWQNDSNPRAANGVGHRPQIKFGATDKSAAMTEKGGLVGRCRRG